MKPYGQQYRIALTLALLAAVLFACLAPARAELACVDWPDLPGRVADDLIPLEELPIVDCPEGIEQTQRSRTVLQFIENVFYEWHEYDLAESDGKTWSCIVMIQPEPGPLTKSEAQVLLSASRLWTKSTPDPDDMVILSSSDPDLDRTPAEPVALGSISLAEIPGEDKGASYDIGSPSINEMPGEPPDTSGTISIGDVIGSDDRTEVGNTESYPWKTVCYVGFDKGSSGKRGSAALVGPYCVLTAGHNVYDQDTSSWVSNFFIAPGQHEGWLNITLRPYGTRDATSLRSTTLYTSGGGFEYDYGAALFSSSFSGNSTYMPLVFDYSPTYINTAGYPKSVQGDSNSMAQWHSESSVTGTGGTDDRLLQYTADTSGGNSGGPVWVYSSSSGTRRIVAVHNSGWTTYNVGARLVSDNECLVKSWLNWRPGTPSAPSGVTASDGTYNYKVSISWNTATKATHYRVYRATSSGGSKSSLGSWQCKTSYNDTTATPGRTYYYFVKSAKSSSGGSASGYSSYNTGWRKLLTPTGISATDGTSTANVGVTWNSVTGASYYRVYRATSSGGTKYVRSSWQSSRTFYDTGATPGTTYYYFVKAATSSTGTHASDYSFYNSGWRKLSPPTGVSATDGTYTANVTVTWNSVSGASYYRLYRATSSGGSKTILGSWQSSRTYYDTAATPGVTYYYFVRAATSNAGYRSSDYSSYNSGWRKLSPPGGVSATDGTSTVNVGITWNSVSGASYYHLFRANSFDGPKAWIGSWQSSRTYYDTWATPGVTYYYFVRAATSSGGSRASDYSSYNFGWRALSPPTGVTATDGSSTANVTVSWNSVSGASHYRVYRATSSGGSKTVLGSWQSSRTYYDTWSTPGVTYYYFIRAATSSGGSRASRYSSYNSGWRALSPPTGVSATDGTSTANVTVTWNSVSGASYYRVYRATSSGGTKTILGSWQSSRTYYDTWATPGVTYYYFVRAATSSSGSRASGYSSYDTGWRALSPPTSVSATDGSYTDKVRVIWGGVSGASYYRVYRATSSGGAKTILSAWQTSLAYNDTSAAPGSATYYYFVQAAVNNTGYRASGLSAYDTGWRALSPPPIVFATDGIYTDKVRVTWLAVTGASHYHVYRATSSGGTKTSIGGWQSSKTYDDTTAAPGTIYYYFVKAAVNNTGYRASGFSGYDTGWALLTYILTVESSPITGVSITGSHSGTTNYSRTLNDETAVSLTAPSAYSAGAVDYHFVRWSLDGVDKTIGATTVSFSMNANHTALAKYAIDTHTLDVQSTPITGVSISGSHAGTTNYTASCDDEEVVNLCAPACATSGVCYRFVRWDVDGAAQPAGQVCIRITMDGDHTAAAEYERLPGDVTGDCTSNVLDLLAVRNHLRQNPGTGSNWKYDVNNDGAINILDLLFVRNSLRTTCP